MSISANSTKNSFITVEVTSALKGLAIILVLITHLSILKYTPSGVSIFLLVSGFGLTQSYIIKGLDQFFSKRLFKVIIPYSIVTALMCVYYFLCTDRQAPSAPTLLATILGVNPNSPIDPTMWYVTFIIFWYLIFYLIFSLRVKDFVKICLIFAGVYVIAPAGSFFHPSSGMVLYLFEFPIGVTIGLVYPWLCTINRSTLKYLILAIALVSIWLNIYFANRINLDFIHFGQITNVCTSIASLSLISAVQLFVNPVRMNKFLGHFGNLSYEIYLVEGNILYLSHFYYLKFSWMPRIAFFLITVVIAARILKLIENKSLKIIERNLKPIRTKVLSSL